MTADRRQPYSPPRGSGRIARLVSVSLALPCRDLYFWCANKTRNLRENQQASNGKNRGAKSLLGMWPDSVGRFRQVRSLRGHPGPKSVPIERKSQLGLSHIADYLQPLRQYALHKSPRTRLHGRRSEEPRISGRRRCNKAKITRGPLRVIAALRLSRIRAKFICIE